MPLYFGMEARAQAVNKESEMGTEPEDDHREVTQVAIASLACDSLHASRPPTIKGHSCK